MSRRKTDKNGCWYRLYEQVCISMRKKYPNMSEEGINYRSWKATNVIFRNYNRKRRAVSK